MDPHSFLVAPNLAVFPNVDPDPALQNCGVTFKRCKKLPYKEYAATDLYQWYDNWVFFLPILIKVFLLSSL